MFASHGRPAFGQMGYVTGAPLPPEMADAYFHYSGLPQLLGGGVGVLVTQGIIQAPQAVVGVKAGIYPSFGKAMIAETGIGLAALPLLLIYIDPAHQIEGVGLDETEWYKRNVEGRWTLTKEQFQLQGPVPDSYDWSSFRG